MDSILDPSHVGVGLAAQTTVAANPSILALSDLLSITVSRNFAYKYGSLPFFGPELGGCFVRRRVPSKRADDPLPHEQWPFRRGSYWVYVTEMATSDSKERAIKKRYSERKVRIEFTHFIDQIVGCSYPDHNPATDVYAAECPWDEKTSKPLNIRFRVALTDELITVDDISSSRPTQTEFDAFFQAVALKNAERLADLRAWNEKVSARQEAIAQRLKAAKESGSGELQEADVERELNAEWGYLPQKPAALIEAPTLDMITARRRAIDENVVHRNYNDDDARAIIRLNSVLHARHMNPVVQAAVLEKATLAVAQSVRGASSTQQRVSQKYQGSASPANAGYTASQQQQQLHFQSQASFSLGANATQMEMGNDMTPTSPRLTSRATTLVKSAGDGEQPASPCERASARNGPQETEAAVLEATEPTIKAAVVVNTQFDEYLADNSRLRQVETLARLTAGNIAHNAMLRERSSQWEKTLNRKGNLIESTGLWEVDDAKRDALAKQYDDMKNKKDKKDEGGAKDGAKESLDPATEAARREEAFFTECCRRASASQELRTPNEQIPEEVIELARRSSRRVATPVTSGNGDGFESAASPQPTANPVHRGAQGSTIGAALAVVASSPAMMTRMLQSTTLDTHSGADARKRLRDSSAEVASPPVTSLPAQRKRV